MIEKEGKLSDFYIKFNPDEEEDEDFFQNEILEKYYHYSKDEKTIQYIGEKRPKTLKNLIWTYVNLIIKMR